MLVNKRLLTEYSFPAKSEILQYAAYGSLVLAKARVVPKNREFEKSSVIGHARSAFRPRAGLASSAPLR